MPRRGTRPTFDYAAASELLKRCFDLAGQQLAQGGISAIPSATQAAADTLFASTTQAYREALVGCALVKCVEPTTDIRRPYVGQGEHAYNGRTLDERVVNPFLKGRSVPCSSGPYLSALRRNVQFVPETLGQRDAKAYSAFLDYIVALEQASTVAEVEALLVYLLSRFIQLREASDVPLLRVKQLSLQQYRRLIDQLVRSPSGGLNSLLVAVAVFKAMKTRLSVDWDIQWQGINVADRASGAGGDITIKLAGESFLTIEVTERPVDAPRVVATFASKIAPTGIEDYMFLLGTSPATPEAILQAKQYFAQGHSVEFLNETEWAVSILATIGVAGRRLFYNDLVELLGDRSVPASVKMLWNDVVNGVVAQG